MRIERVTPHGRPDAAWGVQPGLRGFDGVSTRCSWSGWRRVGPGRSGVAYRRVCGAATPKRHEHVRVTRRQDPLREQRVPRLHWAMRWQDPLAGRTRLHPSLTFAGLRVYKDSWSKQY